MLEGLEALIALERCGTVSEAAVSLRLTQSAVSKRIQALQNEIGVTLTLREGRRLVLTSEAKTYIEKATPLLLDLKNLTRGQASTEGLTDFSLAMADSIASSWGPQIIWKTSQDLPQLHLRLHAHRSVLILEAVRMGRYHLGLCATSGEIPDLISYPVCTEPFVLLNSGLKQKYEAKKPILTIETNSASWSAIRESVQDQSFLAKADFTRVESFQAANQMCAAGFGNALLPLGLTKTMKVSARSYKILPKVARDISIVTRKNFAGQQNFQKFVARLQENARSRFQF